MPPTIGGIGVDPQGQTLIVSVTPSAKVYSDRDGTSLATFPQTISSRTSWFVSAAQQFTISVTLGGAEIAGPNGQPVVVQIDAGQFEWIAPTVDRPSEEPTSATIAAALRGGSQPFARATFVLVFDDVFASQLSAIGQIEARGGRVTLACNTDKLDTAGRMTSAQFAAVVARGHEGAGHSKTHTDMTGQTAAQRATEYDTSKSVIEALTGAGTCRTFVYPFNSLNATLLEEAYGRYDRVLAGPTDPFNPPVADRNGPLIGRRSWYDATHNLVMAAARRAISRDEVFVFYTHMADGSDLSLGVTAVQFAELLALAAAHNVPFVTAAEAIPAFNPFGDPDFDDSALGAWTVTGITGTSTVTSALASGTAAPAFTALAMPGVRLLQTVNDGSSSLVVRSLPVAVNNLGEEITVSVWAASTRSSGTGASTLNVEELDQYGVILATNVGQALSNSVGDVGWTQLKCSFTPNPLTRCYRVKMTQAAMVGTSWWKHVGGARDRYAFTAAAPAASVSIRTVSGTTDTLVLADANNLVEYTNASAITVTVPTNANVAYAVGASILLAQKGTGQVHVVGDSGVTVNARPGAYLGGQYAGATLIKDATDTWLMLGDLST